MKPITKWTHSSDLNSPWDWKDVEALARKSGLTAREVTLLIKESD
ncbi:hypothetical protein [Leptospirillum ferriphilum]|nr:hypothetical protein [Leptospirillum ferriphilum]